MCFVVSWTSGLTLPSHTSVQLPLCSLAVPVGWCLAECAETNGGLSEGILSQSFEEADNQYLEVSDSLSHSLSHSHRQAGLWLVAVQAS